MKTTRPIQMLTAGALSLAFGVAGASAAPGPDNTGQTRVIECWENLIGLEAADLRLPDGFELTPLPDRTPADEARAAHSPLSQLGPLETDEDPPGRIG